MKIWQKVLIGGLVTLVILLLGVVLLSGDSQDNTTGRQQISIETQLK